MGESGEAAALRLAEEGAFVTALDTAKPARLVAKLERMRRRGIATVTGRQAEAWAGACDRAILSPGIDPATPLVQRFIQRRIDMIGELEMSWELCKCPVVAITGTNGKTTTTELVARMLNACGVRTVAAGNIGPSFAAEVRKSAELDVMTLEVSSFQLERIRRFRPRVAVWLNFAPDHLDRYASVEEYRAAKLRLFENQTGEDLVIANLRDLPALGPLAGKVTTFSAHESGGDFSLRDGVIYFRGEPALRMGDAKLRGLHNAENIMAAMGVGIAHGLAPAQMAPALCSYTAKPHRCELVRELDGVAYVNDSKATNLDALEQALVSETRPVVLIAGGKDKGFEFDSIAGLVAKKARAVVLIGEMAQRIARCWSGCEIAGSLREAVEMARAQARPGDVVLFSPGTSSFDMFRDYADRGSQFRDIAQSL